MAGKAGTKRWRDGKIFISCTQTKTLILRSNKLNKKAFMLWKIRDGGKKRKKQEKKKGAK